MLGSAEDSHRMAIRSLLLKPVGKSAGLQFVPVFFGDERARGFFVRFVKDPSLVLDFLGAVSGRLLLHVLVDSNSFAVHLPSSPRTVSAHNFPILLEMELFTGFVSGFPTVPEECCVVADV